MENTPEQLNNLTELLNFIEADEGSLNQIYGRIGSGKTYIATSMIFDDLMRGQVVYANWRVNFEGFDERKDKFALFLGLLGFKKLYLDIPKHNFHFIDTSSHDFHIKLGSLTDCIVYLDEGHLVFDSYITTKMPVEHRANILHTRHFNRTINVISQRSSAIHPTIRGNVNRFFKCEKGFHIFSLIRFHLYEYQDTNESEKPDETLDPVSHKSYFGKKSIFNAYDTKYLRGDMPVSQPNWTKGYILTWKEKWDLFWGKEKKPINEKEAEYFKQLSMPNESLENKGRE